MVFEWLGKNIGYGAVFCFVSQAIPLSFDVTAIPVGLL